MSGFVYIWRDRKHNRYYIGSHWGSEDDGYVCSSAWMMQAYKIRPKDFRRKILSKINTSRKDLLKEEQRWFDMVKPEEVKIRYYNLKLKAHGVWHANESSKLSVGEKISKAKKGKNIGKRDPNVGEKISEAKKRKCANRRESIGSSFTEEHRKAMSECKIGKAQTAESNEKRSKTLKEKYNSGEISRERKPLSDYHRSNIGNGLRGIKHTEEAKANMSKSQSKTYVIKYKDGTSIVAVGLKTFCINNSIPYVTARKALEAKSPIKKYSIESISSIEQDTNSDQSG